VVGNSEKITGHSAGQTAANPAKIVRRDEKTDLALVKNRRQRPSCPFVAWGDSNEAKVGDWVNGGRQNPVSASAAP